MVEVAGIEGPAAPCSNQEEQKDLYRPNPADGRGCFVKERDVGGLEDAEGLFDVSMAQLRNGTLLTLIYPLSDDVSKYQTR